LFDDYIDATVKFLSSGRTYTNKNDVRGPILRLSRTAMYPISVTVSESDGTATSVGTSGTGKS